MMLQPGSLILDGKYRVEAFIGKGASAEVYRVTHVLLRARRAIKVLRRDDNAGVGSTAYGDFRRRFEFEAQLGAQINQANIVHVYDFVEQDAATPVPTLMLVMEYAAGGSLAERLLRLREGGVTMPVGEAVGIALDVASGLAVLHKRDAVHRDLKPSNILLDTDGQAKVADLGLAQVPGGPSLRSQLSAALPHPGTPAYMSPEQVNSGAYLTSASDVYSLGLVLFEMLTGRAYKNARIGTRASSLQPGIPTALDDLIARMLSKDDEARPFDGDDVAQQLRATGIAPTWNRDEAWQRQMLALAMPTVTARPPDRTPKPAPTPAPTAGQSQPLAAESDTEPLPPLPRPVSSNAGKRPAWFSPAVGLGMIVALAILVIALLPKTAPVAPDQPTTAAAALATQAVPTRTSTAAATSALAATAAPTSAPTAEQTTAPTTEPMPTVAPTATATAVPTAIPPTDTPVPPSPTPVIANFDGAWLTNFATLSLRQDAKNVVGTYQRYGHSEALGIQGIINDNRLSGFYMGDPAKTFEFNLNADGQGFAGTWKDTAGNAYQWCGVRSGPLPNGCGFSGKWSTIGDYEVNYPPTADIVQTGDAVRGSFLNGVEKSAGTIVGTVGAGGPGSQYTASGQWSITRFKGPFRWVLVDFERIGAGQFQGRSVTADGKAHQWCGWREGSTRPLMCIDR